MEGVGPGFPGAPDVELGGGGGGGAFFVACPAGFSSFCDSFFKTKVEGADGVGLGSRGPSPRSDTLYPMSFQYIKPAYPFLGLEFVKLASLLSQPIIKFEFQSLYRSFNLHNVRSYTLLSSFMDNVNWPVYDSYSNSSPFYPRYFSLACFYMSNEARYRHRTVLNMYILRV